MTEIAPVGFVRNATMATILAVNLKHVAGETSEALPRMMGFLGASAQPLQHLDFIENW